MNDQKDQNSPVVKMTVGNFEDQLKNAGDKPVFVDFYADWCGPCQMAAPVIDKLGEQYQDKAVIAKVNIDEESSLAQDHGVMSVPTVVMFKNGEEVERQTGFAGEQGYVDMLDRALKD